MSRLPSEESIKQISDPATLQGLCIRLIDLCEKESVSKREYKQGARALRKELKDKELEFEALLEKSRNLEEISRKIVNESNPALVPVEIQNDEIEKLSLELKKKEEERKELISVLEGNKAKADEKIGKLKAENDRLKSELGAFESMKMERVEIVKENEDLKTRVNDLIHEHEFIIGKMRKTQQSVVECAKFKEKNGELSELIENLKLDLLSQKKEVEERERIQAVVADAMDERNSTIVKLKTLLSRSVKEGQRKQQQLDDIQEEMERIEQQLSLLSHQPNDADKCPEGNIDSELANMMEKNRKLQEMLETSNHLYSELLKEHRQRIQEYENGKRNSCNFTIICDEIFAKDTEEHNAEIQQLTKEARREAKLVRGACLRRTLLQFFSEQDESERGALIPIILSFVGCNEEQVSIVMRQWERNQQLIHKTATFLGLK